MSLHGLLPFFSFYKSREWVVETEIVEEAEDVAEIEVCCSSLSHQGLNTVKLGYD